MTNCMAMRMSETRHGPAVPFSAWVHAGEVAQWVLLLLGWLWLGEQGMRLGWSLASGVLAVSLWWAARLVCRGSNWALRASPAVIGLCGAFSALGVWLPEALRTMDSGAFNLAHVGLLAVALLWGLWSGMVETRSRVSTFDLGGVAWHPVLAALGVALVWWMPAPMRSATGGVAALLALCAVVLYARERANAGAMLICRGQRAGGSSVLVPSAMGLMMGGLWLGHAWCVGLGWSTSEMVLGHLAMMAVLPALVALVGRMLTSSEAPTGVGRLRRRSVLSLVLLALGALMLLGDSAAHGFLVMLLPSLAWAMHCSRSRIGGGFVDPSSPGLARTLALCLGPGLLIWVGKISPLQGPYAMQMALALLGILAAMQALVLCVPRFVAHPAGVPPDHFTFLRKTKAQANLGD